MLQQIQIIFPVDTKEEHVFYISLEQFFGELENVSFLDKQIVIQATNPINAFSKLVMSASENKNLKINFACDDPEQIHIDQLIEEVITNHGAQQVDSAKITLRELSKMLKGHLRRIDHAGLNLPTSRLSKANWHALLQDLSKVTAIYNYPTGEDWPFILPTTKEEFQTEITNFCSGREPKFELVYDEYAQIPTIQFDIEVDLNQKEVEKLLPYPLGQSFAGLENVFRAVYIKSPFRNLQIRFDIRFARDVQDREWQTGKWLVEEGKRIKNV